MIPQRLVKWKMYFQCRYCPIYPNRNIPRLVAVDEPTKTRNNDLLIEKMFTRTIMVDTSQPVRAVTREKYLEANPVSWRGQSNV